MTTVEWQDFSGPGLAPLAPCSQAGGKRLFGGGRARSSWLLGQGWEGGHWPHTTLRQQGLGGEHYVVIIII